MEYRKNLHSLLDAYEYYCNNTHKPFGLIITGDPAYISYANEITNKIKKLQSNGLNIQYHSSVTDKKIVSI